MNENVLAGIISTLLLLSIPTAYFGIVALLVTLENYWFDKRNRHAKLLPIYALLLSTIVFSLTFYNGIWDINESGGGGICKCNVTYNGKDIGSIQLSIPGHKPNGTIAISYFAKGSGNDYKYYKLHIEKGRIVDSECDKKYNDAIMQAISDNRIDCKSLSCTSVSYDKLITANNFSKKTPGLSGIIMGIVITYFPTLILTLEFINRKRIRNKKNRIMKTKLEDI